MSDDDLQEGNVKGRKDERGEGGVDSIISNLMAAFNGNTITFGAEREDGMRGIDSGISLTSFAKIVLTN